MPINGQNARLSMEYFDRIRDGTLMLIYASPEQQNARADEISFEKYMTNEPVTCRRRNQ
jgi:hypothetical protein